MRAFVSREHLKAKLAKTGHFWGFTHCQSGRRQKDVIVVVSRKGEMDRHPTQDGVEMCTFDPVSVLACCEWGSMVPGLKASAAAVVHL